ncbi:hypothetical protein Tco_0214919 [Tanacetum coccineum]
MRTRSQARRRRQPQVRQTSVESSNLENKKPDNPLIVTMADNSYYGAHLLEATPRELHQLDTFYNALNSIDQDSLNSAAGEESISSKVLKDMSTANDGSVEKICKTASTSGLESLPGDPEGDNPASRSNSEQLNHHPPTLPNKEQYLPGVRKELQNSVTDNKR